MLNYTVNAYLLPAFERSVNSLIKDRIVQKKHFRRVPIPYLSDSRKEPTRCAPRIRIPGFNAVGMDKMILNLPWNLNRPVEVCTRTSSGFASSSHAGTEFVSFMRFHSSESHKCGYVVRCTVYKGLPFASDLPQFLMLFLY